MCMDSRKFEDTAMSSFKKLMRRLGDSNITLKEWRKSDYNIFDVLVKGTRLKFNIFFFTGVRMNPKNNSKHIFFVSENYNIARLLFCILSKRNYMLCL